MAHLSLKSGSCRAAVVAGVKLILTPGLSAMFTKAGMLSPDGRCKTLDAAADGYVRAEAVAAMMLQAVPAGSGSSSEGSYAALVLGSAVNQDGRSSGLTAPNGPAQQTVLRAALADGGLQAPDVTTLFMHGTGTPLGKHINSSPRLVLACLQSRWQCMDSAEHGFPVQFLTALHHANCRAGRGRKKGQT